MKKLKITGIILLAATMGVLRGQEPDTGVRSLSLDEAVSFALEHNLNVANARLDVTAADKRVWEATASGLPQMDASFNYNNNLALATTLIPDFFNDPSEKIEVQFGTKHYATAGLRANQIIFSGQYIIGLQTAKLYKEFMKKNRDLSEQQVKEAVIQGYYLVLLSESTLEALRGNLQNIKTSYQETLELYNAGFVEETDAEQLEVTLADLENSVLSMERQVVASRNLLKYQMGMILEDEIELTDDLDQMVGDLELQVLLDLQMEVEENIEYQLLKDQERLAEMDLKLKKTDYMPNLSAFFSLDFTAQRQEFNLFDSEEDWYKASAVGLSLNVPVFSSGLRMAAVAQKKIAYEQAVNNREFASRGMKVDFMQAQYDFANALEKYKREEKSLELTKKVAERTRAKYEEGMASSLDLTQLNDQYLRTLTNYTSAMVDLLNAKLSLDRLLNKL